MKHYLIKRCYNILQIDYLIQSAYLNIKKQFMFGLFKKKSASLKSISIPHFSWTIDKVSKGMKQWISPEQTMALSINFFDGEPDIPKSNDIEIIRSYFRGMMSQNNGGLLSVDFIELEGYKAIKTTLKVPIREKDMMYLTSITIPFKTCSYVIKIEAPELGAEQPRDEAMASKLVLQGKVKLTPNEKLLSDPYLKEYTKGTLMNKSEEVIHDIQFMDHPLSQARQWIKQIEKEIEFKSELKDLEQY